MISKRIEKLLNDQFRRELFSAHLYFSMSSYFLSRDLDGFANFFRVQAEEELMHGMKDFDYVHQVDGKIRFPAIEAPEVEFNSILDVFKKTLEHEQLITRHINEIYKAAMEEADFATQNFLRWFIDEQVEEEALFRTMIAKLQMIGEDKSALYMMNEELMARKAEPAA
jgi:ferritin